MSHGTKSAGAPPSPMHSASPGTRRRIRPPPDASITQVEPLQLLEARADAVADHLAARVVRRQRRRGGDDEEAGGEEAERAGDEEDGVRGH